MATQAQSDANAAKLLAQGLSQDFISAELAKGKSGAANGSFIDDKDVAGFLSAFKASGNPYSSQNISATTTAPVAKPDMSDPLALRQYYLDQMGVPTALTELQDINNRLSAFDTQTEQTLNAIENKPIRMGVITGEEAATERGRATTRSSLAREALAKQSFVDAARSEANTRFDIANSERDTLQQLIIKSGGQAGITFGDTVAEASKKLSKYEDKKAEEQAKEDRKQKLKDLALSAGISTKNKKGGSLSTKDLEKAIAKAAKKDKDLEDELNRIKMDSAKVDLAKAKKDLAGAGNDGYDDTEVAQWADIVMNGASLSTVPAKIRNLVGGAVLDVDPNFKFNAGADSGFTIEE